MSELKSHQFIHCIYSNLLFHCPFELPEAELFEVPAEQILWEHGFKLRQGGFRLAAFLIRLSSPWSKLPIQKKNLVV